MRTRCKFKVVGIEETDHEVCVAHYADTMPAEQYEALKAFEQRDGDRRYKWATIGKRAQNIRLAAQYDPTIPEDQRFMEATPTGELKFYVSNPAVIGGFKIGANYYVDLTPCE